MANRELLLPEQEQVKLAVGLCQAGLFGVKENPEEFIELKSERRSPHYLNIRPGLSVVSERGLIVGAMGSLMKIRARHMLPDSGDPAVLYNHVVGTPEAMTSYAAIVADQHDMGLLQPRVDTKKVSGNKSPILGRYLHGDSVVALDDVVTDGASKIDTIKSLRNVGLGVADYFVVLDREEGGAPQVRAETGIPITPAIGVTSLVNILYAERMITQTQYDNVAEYIGQYGDPHARQALGVA